MKRHVKRLALKTEIVRQLSRDQLEIVNGAWWTTIVTACDYAGCTGRSYCDYC